MSPKPDPETVFAIYENTRTAPEILRSVLCASRLEPMLGPRAFADIGGPAMDQSPDGVFAIAQAVVVVISEEMGANTVTILMANRATLWVGLFGIDVPESRQDEHFLAQPYGPEAIAYLQGLAQGQWVRVEIYGVDGHHRLLGTLFIEERNF